MWKWWSVNKIAVGKKAIIETQILSFIVYESKDAKKPFYHRLTRYEWAYMSIYSTEKSIMIYYVYDALRRENDGYNALRCLGNYR